MSEGVSIKAIREVGLEHEFVFIKVKERLELREVVLEPLTVLARVVADLGRFILLVETDENVHLLAVRFSPL